MPTALWVMAKTGEAGNIRDRPRDSSNQVTVRPPRLRRAAGTWRKSLHAGHYSSHRPHRTPGQRPPAGPTHPPAMSTNVKVLRTDRLGGLIHEYSQAA